MDRETLRKLEMLNQLSLTEEEKQSVTAFFTERDTEFAILDKIDTENVERMVHVNPINNVLREDVVIKKFDREDLQQDAPETDEGYWCVPKVVE